MKLLRNILTAGILGVSLSVMAAPNLPYEAEGMIYDMPLDTGMINVGDIMYYVPEGVRVNYPSGDIKNGIENLSTNTPIGYTLQGEVISEIWVLDRAPIDHSVNDD